MFRVVIMWNDGTVTGTDHKTWVKALAELASIMPRERKDLLAATIMNVQVGQ